MNKNEKDYEIVKKTFPNAKIYFSPGNDIDWVVIEPNSAIILVNCNRFFVAGISDTYYMTDVTNGLKSK